MMFGWIPLFGPILQGIFNTVAGLYFKYKDTQVDLRKQDVEEAKVAAQIIKDTNDDIGIRIIRDAALVMPVLWGALIGWDTIVAIRYPWLMFHVENYPKSVEYIPYMAYVFLFGVIGMNIWKRK